MKIGVVTPRYPPNVLGGGELSARLLVENLRDKGHDVEVLAFDEEHPEDPEYVIRKDAFSSRADLLNLQGFKTIKDFAKDKDVIHSYNSVFHPTVSRLDSTKTVATLNNYLPHPELPNHRTSETLIRKIYESTYLRIYSSTTLRLMRDIDVFVALSTDVKKAYSKFLDSNKIQVIPNMYDPEFPKFKRIETRDKELLFVGTLHPHKGVEDLLEQMTDLEEYHLRIVGDGPEKQKLEEKTEQMKINERVTFEGYMPHKELPRVYERAEWFIHPGKWAEPFGRTILEAIQMKTPVIATNKGGPRDVLTESQRVEDVTELKDLIPTSDIEAIIEDQNSRLESYSPSHVTNEIEKIYRNIVIGRH